MPRNPQNSNSTERNTVLGQHSNTVPLLAPSRVPYTDSSPEPPSSAEPSSNKVICRQLNTHKSSICCSELFVQAATDVRYLYFVTEPYIHNEQPASLPRHNLLFGGKSPRAALLADVTQQITLMPQFSSRDVTTATWLPRGDSSFPKQVILMSVYWDGSFAELPAELEKALEFSSERDIPILITGDFNAHSTLWYSKDTDRRGATA